MKLFKGLLTIALIAILAVSCKEAKKGADAMEDGVENVANAAKEGVDDTANAVKEAVSGDESKCDKDCKKPCCANKDGKDHKCTDAKCSADCKEADCTKCAAKAAECKEKCAAKKA